MSSSRFRFMIALLIICITCGELANRLHAAPEPEHLLNKSNQELARERLLLLLSGEWISRSLYVVSKLEVADYLLQGPKSINELATLTKANPEMLRRVLHMLAGFGVFEETSTGLFSNSQTSLLLSKANPDTLHSLSLFYGEDIHKSFEELLPAVQTGMTAFDLAYKQSVFPYLKEHPARASLFQEAMKEKSTAVIHSVHSSYPFGLFKTVYDIGGGYGHFMWPLLAQNTNLKGIVFDTPEVIATTKARNPNFENKRCKLIAGDFFDSVPSGGDVYVLKSILHDWDDPKAEVILRNCYTAMKRDSRLLIIEVVLLPKDQSTYANCMDVLMMTVTGGKERTIASFEKLLDLTGFTLERVIKTSTEFSILEARKR